MNLERTEIQMAYQAIFKRYELKYMLTLEQKQRLLEAMAPYMALDQYGRTTIRNIYYDTDTYRLIRHSIEKPVYKEKLRIRSYHQAENHSPVFVELKKKYDSVVYKRRLSLPQHTAMEWLSSRNAFDTDADTAVNKQIAAEIDYFKDFYETLRPTVFLSYEREAYYAKDGSDFRITFDDTILCRQDNLTLTAAPGGIPLLEDGKVLMEIKTGGGIPLWMTEVLTKEKIYKTAFSKYGTAYQKIIYPNQGGHK